MRLNRTRVVSRFAGAAVLVAVLIQSPPVHAWGSGGHEATGAVADALLDPDLRGQVHNVLGVDLATAAVWADCVKSVKRSGDTFTYSPDQYTPKTCKAFAEGDEKARMEDYARRNWFNCDYRDGGQCHGAYHFADIGIQRSRYWLGYEGTSDHDIVQAINAAIAVIEGKPCLAPFSIKDRKEALFLLAHFLGDLHQPLHVGSVYLDDAGRLIDPDNPKTDPVASFTVGGNILMLSPTKNLHSEWDGIPASLIGPPSQDLLAKARKVEPTKGPLDTWGATWATDTLRVAPKAFRGLRFGAATKDDKGRKVWSVSIDKPERYAEDEAKLKAGQIAKGGARLAQLLTALAPSIAG